MFRAIVLVTLAVVIPIPRAMPRQATSVLHIKVVLADADGKATPVPHHALLISENPASATPRRILTGLDGSADVKLRPGNYTVESDQPVVFHGKAYQWTEMIDVVAGRDATLELTAGNADVAPDNSPAAAAKVALEDDPSFLLPQWQDSVFTLWTPTIRATAFLFDPRGLVATSQRAVGTATSVEVQLSPTVKVAASVLIADAPRDVAVLRIDPGAGASIKAVPLGCAATSPVPLLEKQELYTIGVPAHEQKGMTTGTVSAVDAHRIVTDFVLASGSAGGPVFASGGRVVGITSQSGDEEDGRRGNVRVIRVEDACYVAAAAEKKMEASAPPNGAHLPVEPDRPFPLDALKEASKGRAGNLNPYQLASSDFDVAFITPVLTFGAQYQAEQARDRDRSSGARTADPEQGLVPSLKDFSTWSDYVADFPPVLLVRATPRLVENFWTTVARGAAMTQGVSVPAIKRLKSGFARMRAFCGDTEVTPIHPFRLEQRVGDGEAIYEGLYVFDPGALGPQCGTVKLLLYSEKEPEKADTRVVDPKLVEQIWRDFEPYRAQK